MGKRTKEADGYADAVRQALANGKPVAEAVLARAVLREVGIEKCIAVRRHYARLAWVQAGHARKGWKPGDMKPDQEALLGASIFARRALRGLGVKKKVVNGERIYSLVAGKAAPRKGEQR